MESELTMVKTEVIALTMAASSASKKQDSILEQFDQKDTRLALVYEEKNLATA